MTIGDIPRCIKCSNYMFPGTITYGGYCQYCWELMANQNETKYNYKCPECGELLQIIDNKEKVKEIGKEIKELEKEIKRIK